MKALVLAAGLGTRLRPYTYITPKPLFTVAGVTMLDRLIAQLEDAGCDQIMVNTHHLSEKITGHIRKSSYRARVMTVHEPKILDTGGALKNLESFWTDSPFFVVNSDIYTDFDFSLLYMEHMRSGAAATLLMHDDPRFNNVAVRQDLTISGFRTSASHDERLLAFTGIQVVSPLILDFIPSGVHYSIIDAYGNLISKREKVNAFVQEGLIWEDMGTPEAYLSLSAKILSENTFKAGFSVLDKKKLKGDGSDRKWFRISSKESKLVLAEHGIKNTDSVCEAESFFLIGKHLGAKGVNVPGIISADVFSGHVLVEDLGNTHLADFVHGSGKTAVKRMYEKVISGLACFSVRGAEDFDDSWTWQTPEYSKDMVLEKECNYFRDAFLQNYLGISFSAQDLSPAFEFIASGASAKGFKGLMHRDFQSRNIMIRDGVPYFIDFQGARRGPFEYDLSSLLIDPYVCLEDTMKQELEDYAFAIISGLADYDRAEFNDGLAFCKVARNLQILGAFSFLSMAKGKKYFESYIPQSVAGLEKNLSFLPNDLCLRPLKELVAELIRKK